VLTWLLAGKAGLHISECVDFGWSDRGLGLPFAGLDVVWVGRGQGWPYARLAEGWAGHGLGWACAGLDIGWVGHGLGWPWDWQAHSVLWWPSLGLARNVLSWAGGVLWPDNCWPVCVLYCKSARMSMGWAGLGMGWPWTNWSWAFLDMVYPGKGLGWK
jgi:hypothetical protein